MYMLFWCIHIENYGAQNHAASHQSSTGTFLKVASQLNCVDVNGHP